MATPTFDHEPALAIMICSCGWQGTTAAVLRRIDTRTVRVLCPKCDRCLVTDIEPDPETGSPFGKPLS